MSTLAPQLAVQLTVADPDVAGPLAVFPLIADRSPNVRYLSFAAAVKHGAVVRELAEGASVNDLVVHNPLDVPVLLYEGEEVLGAQQNRTFDCSALVAAGSQLRVPVSCVEQGRWDGGRHAEPFAPSPQAAYPQLRRAKNEQARAQLAAGLEGFGGVAGSGLAYEGELVALTAFAAQPDARDTPRAGRARRPSQRRPR